MIIPLLAVCVATANPRAKRSTESTVASPTQTTTSPECGSIPSLVYQHGRDGRDGRDGLPGPFGPSGTKGEKGDPGVVVQGATGPIGMYVYVHSSLFNGQHTICVQYVKMSSIQLCSTTY